MSALRYLVAAKIVADTLEEGRKRAFKPLTCAVLDAGGHLVALGRDDDSSLLRPQIAIGKAWSVLGMGFGGRELARRASGSPAFFNALIELSGGNMVPVPGGVLIRDNVRGIVGSVGVSGDTSENDELCAVAAIHLSGLHADTGETT
jgi:uncharacterized protein GlcG (DUF336 family)